VRAGHLDRVDIRRQSTGKPLAHDDINISPRAVVRPDNVVDGTRDRNVSGVCWRGPWNRDPCGDQQYGAKGSAYPPLLFTFAH
jgi:hypothetical protein